MQEISNLIGSLGFPIVMTLLLFFKLDKTMGVLIESVNNNTVVITKLATSYEQKGIVQDDSTKQ